MRGRLTASMIALVILVTGVIPAVAGYRCVAMGMRMEAPSPCCHHDDDAATLAPTCCEAVAAASVQPRHPASASELTVPPPIVIGAIVFVAPPALASTATVHTAQRARGRPPGEQLELLSTVLRV